MSARVTVHLCMSESLCQERVVFRGLTEHVEESVGGRISEV